MAGVAVAADTVVVEADTVAVEAADTVVVAADDPAATTPVAIDHRRVNGRYVERSLASAIIPNRIRRESLRVFTANCISNGASHAREDRPGKPIAQPFGLVLGGGQGPEDGEHGIEVSQPGPESIDEVAEGEVAFQQIIVIILDVIGQVAHQGGMDLLEPAQSLAAGIEDVLVAHLPPLELGALACALLPADLEQLPGDLELLPLDLQDLPLGFQGLVLEVGQEMEEEDGVVGVGDGRRVLTRGGNLHAIGPGCCARWWIFARWHSDLPCTRRRKFVRSTPTAPTAPETGPDAFPCPFYATELRTNRALRATFVRGITSDQSSRS